MNFSAFGGPFSGIHQFAAKFGHDSQNGPFGSSSSSMNTQEVHGNRYHANGNHFNQNSTSSKIIAQYFENNLPRGEKENVFFYVENSCVLYCTYVVWK